MVKTKCKYINAPIYKVWKGMIYRCTKPWRREYKDYGARGITVEDPRWLQFENFLADMGMPTGKKYLDRIDNSRGYCKDNCRWATNEESLLNRSVTVWITYNGVKKSLSQWARDLKLNPDTIIYRIRKGYEIERALKPGRINSRD